MDNSEKIESLKKYIERQKQQLTNPTERRKGDEVFAAWLQRDIDKHQKRLDELQLFATKK